MSPFLASVSRATQYKWDQTVLGQLVSDGINLIVNVGVLPSAVTGFILGGSL